MDLGDTQCQLTKAVWGVLTVRLLQKTIKNTIKESLEIVGIFDNKTRTKLPRKQYYFEIVQKQRLPNPIFFLIFLSTFIFPPFLSLTGVVSGSRAIGGSTSVGGGPCEALGQAGQWQAPLACLTLIQLTPIIFQTIKT